MLASSSADLYRTSSLPGPVIERRGPRLPAPWCLRRCRPVSVSCLLRGPQHCKDRRPDLLDDVLVQLGRDLPSGSPKARPSGQAAPQQLVHCQLAALLGACPGVPHATQRLFCSSLSVLGSWARRAWGPLSPGPASGCPGRWYERGPGKGGVCTRLAFWRRIVGFCGRLCSREPLEGGRSAGLGAP